MMDIKFGKMELLHSYQKHGQLFQKIHTVHLFQINIVQQDLKLKIHLNVK